jgi:putative ABC transport system ATP-binding protein
MLAEATQTAVSCRGLRKDFYAGDVVTHAVAGVDLDVPAGKITMLVGPSGCGKTTLLSIIAGILTPSAGTVTVLDHPLHEFTNGEKVVFRRRNLGFIFQQYNLLPALDAAENAAIPLVADGWTRRKAVAKAAELLERLGMAGHTRKLPRQLSGGQQQRVAIARALVHEPRLVVCDEPTAALDAHTGHAVMELLRDIAVQPDRAVIVVTHDTRVLNYAHRIAYMDDGRIERIEEVAAGPAGGES